MMRRNFIENTAVAALGLAAGTLGVTTAFGKDNPGASTANGLLIQDPAILKKLPSFVATLHKCLEKGEACFQHCQEELSGGAREFARCSAAVGQMVVLCDATSRLAAMKASELGSVLDTCLRVCQNCKDACDEHKPHWQHGMHLECKACSEECARVIAEGTELAKLFKKAG